MISGVKQQKMRRLSRASSKEPLRRYFALFCFEFWGWSTLIWCLKIRKRLNLTQQVQGINLLSLMGKMWNGLSQSNILSSFSHVFNYYLWNFSFHFRISNDEKMNSNETDESKTIRKIICLIRQQKQNSKQQRTFHLHAKIYKPNPHQLKTCVKSTLLSDVGTRVIFATNMKWDWSVEINFYTSGSSSWELESFAD